MFDSHLMLSAMKITLEIRRTNDPEEAGQEAA
jgi:hypothetical protein